MLYLDHSVTAVCCFPGRKKQVEVLEPARMGLFDRIDRAVTCSFLQLAFGDAVGLDLYLERARECGVDGGDVALPLAAAWLSLAMDS